MAVSRHVAACLRASLAQEGAGSRAAAEGSVKGWARLPPHAAAAFASLRCVHRRGGCRLPRRGHRPRREGATPSLWSLSARSLLLPRLTPQRAPPPGRSWQMAALVWLRGSRYSSRHKPFEKPSGFSVAVFRISDRECIFPRNKRRFLAQASRCKRTLLGCHVAVQHLVRRNPPEKTRTSLPVSSFASQAALLRGEARFRFLKKHVQDAFVSIQRTCDYCCFGAYLCEDCVQGRKCPAGLVQMDAILSCRPDDLEDYYKLLGCDELSTVEQILAEFKIKALECHPDKHPGNPKAVENFQKLQQAKEILTNEESRARYDYWRRSKITIPFQQWEALSNSVKTSMHWAVQSKKDQMLEAPDLNNSNNITNEIWTQQTENSEDGLSDGNREQEDVAIPDVKPQSSKNPDSPRFSEANYWHLRFRWSGDAPSELLRKFRNYEI